MEEWEERCAEAESEDQVLDRILHNEREQILYQAIKKLSVNQQKIVILQYFSKLSIQEIAVLLHLSQENVRVLSHRARKQLKNDMEASGYEIS